MGVKIYPGGVGPLAPDIIAAVRESNGFVIELGVHTGEGSLSMIQDALELHPTPLHISVDWEDLIAREHRPVAPWWRLVIGDSRSSETLTHVQSLVGTSARRAGLIFIDTDHNYQQMSAELALWNALADDSTIWLGHDSWMFGVWNADMMRAVTEFADQYGWTYDDLRQDSHGLWRLSK